MIIEPVIVMAPRQRALVRRLEKYCLDLDGTQIRVIGVGGGCALPYPACNNAAFHQAAVEMKGKPFIWLEPDSIPTKDCWDDYLSEAFEWAGKPFLLSSDSQPHDLIGGIGVYGPDTAWLIPEHIETGGWDGWMLRHLEPLIARTPLIQHSYGSFNGEVDGAGLAIATPHIFPRDSYLLRSDAVIFHRDRDQTLIPGQRPIAPNRFWHSGDLGDIIAALPTVRALGGGEIVIGYRHNGQRESMQGARYDAVKPLLEAQPYISGVEWNDSMAGATHDFSGFRSHRTAGDNLAEWQARHLSIQISLEPWLTVPDIPKNGHIVISRSERYHNDSFPWQALLWEHKHDIVFVGLEHEHATFQARFNVKIYYHHTDNLLELARVIAGARLFIGNQSCPWWIAAGLGVPMIQETWAHDQNSVILRPNARYSRTQFEAKSIPKFASEIIEVSPAL